MVIAMNFILFDACLILHLWLYRNLFSQCLGGHSGFLVCTLLKAVFSLGVFVYVHKSSG